MKSPYSDRCLNISSVVLQIDNMLPAIFPVFAQPNRLVDDICLFCIKKYSGVFSASRESFSFNNIVKSVDVGFGRLD